MQPILAEFVPVPNAPSDVVSASASPRISANPDAQPGAATANLPPDARPAEFGGPPGPEPTRFGDWEKNGRCIDF
ncbi:MAG: DUF1674 domain-containing protein [Steroidobacteraceae bacterium]|nr:DUF1674 domain-containing protein [Steroidobacteraceae bacterium]